MLIAYFPALVAIIGVLMHVLSANGKVSEIGRLMFFAGQLVTLMSVADKTARLF
jgi:hypothetical protein